jgi:CRP-like cAMP-binding protein
MAADEKIRFPLFRGLNPEEIERVEELCEVVRFRDGEVIFREGEEAIDLHLVRSGRISLHMSLPNEKSLVVYTVEEGELLGWSALRRGKKYTASGVAVGPVEAVRIHGEDLLRLFAEDNRMGMIVYRELVGAVAERLEESRMRIAQMWAS